MKRIFYYCIYLILILALTACWGRSSVKAHDLRPDNQVRLERSTMLDQEKFVDEMSMITDSLEPKKDYFIQTVFQSPANGELVISAYSSSMTYNRGEYEEGLIRRRETLIKKILEDLWGNEMYGPVFRPKLISVLVSWHNNRDEKFAVYDKDVDGVWDIGIYAAGKGAINVGFDALGEGPSTRQELKLNEGISVNLQPAPNVSLFQMEFIIRSSR
ncbi:hypothetical protein IKF04_01375 [Candidatus Saccharibacteria bacterium]|nr:hypothetical protein [Candidatus Saccharibacteria bacterium]